MAQLSIELRTSGGKFGRAGAGFRRLGQLLLAALFVVGCASGQGPSGTPSADPGASSADPTTTPGPADASGTQDAGGAQTQDTVSAPTPVGAGPSAGERAQSAVEGLLMGAIIGGQAGPIGAAVGAGTLLIYSAITGDVPFQTGGSGRGSARSEAEREAQIEEQIEAEIARQDSLESQIEEELQRQEELLRQIERDEAVGQAAEMDPASSTQERVLARADPRVAPTAPLERDLPATIFEEETLSIPAGEWDNPREIQVLARSLDADRDGKPEEIRYHDQTTGAMVRKEEDKNYDGSIDTWTQYESGLPVEIARDHDNDGSADEWERYGSDGRMVARDVDRDADGTRDGFYRYEAGSLVEERHDGDGNGSVDRIIRYENRKVARSEEDRDLDGAMDTWTTYRSVNGEEIVDRIEKDTSGDGRSDTFESYEQVAGKTVLTKREEDKNGDGVIDVKSLYENGKLKQREISDPALTPL